MNDDIFAIRQVVEPLCKARMRIILVCHSAGGFLGSAAVKNLEVGGTQTGHGGGGVEKLIFVTAGLVAPGQEAPASLPFMDFQEIVSSALTPITPFSTMLIP
ncbi:hypothetical protein V1509DRAFT_624735 [Lipomyces kononenkoae]